MATHILTAKEYQRIRFDEIGINTRVHLAWHRGEATVLPSSYVEEVLNLQQEVLGTEVFDTGQFANAVQTNLYQLNSTLDLMIDQQFLLSVSLDFMSGRWLMWRAAMLNQRLSSRFWQCVFTINTRNTRLSDYQVSLAADEEKRQTLIRVASQSS